MYISYELACTVVYTNSTGEYEHTENWAFYIDMFVKFFYMALYIFFVFDEDEWSNCHGQITIKCQGHCKNQTFMIHFMKFSMPIS